MGTQHTVWIGALLLTASSCGAADLTTEQVRDVIATAQAGTRAQLAGRDLSELDLSRVDFRQADLAGASLFGTKLVLANLAGADLSNATAPTWQEPICPTPALE